MISKFPVNKISLAKKISYIGLFLSLLLFGISLKIETGIGLSITFVFAFLTYILLEPKKNYQAFNGVLYNNSGKLCLIFLFIILISTSLMLFSIQETSSRNIVQHIYISFLIGLIAVELSSIKKNSSIYLAHILAISTFIIVSGIVIFPNIGSDQLFHEHFANSIRENGHLLSDTIYGSFPLMHIGITMLSLLTEIHNEQYLLISFVAIPYIITSVTVFLLGQKVVGTKKSLFAMLLLSINIWYIFWGIYSVPMTFSFSIFMLAVYLFFKKLFNNSIAHSITLLLLMFILILSHPMAALSFFIFMLCCYLLLKIQQRYIEKNLKYSLKSYSIGLFAVSFVGYTMFNAYYFMENQILSLLSDSHNTMGILKLTSQKSFIVYEFDYIALYLLYILFTFGVLRWIKNNSTNPLKNIIVFVTLSYLFIGYASWIIGVQTIIPHRWFFYSIIFLVIPASEGFGWIIDKIKNAYIKQIVSFLILFLIAFLSLNSSITNVDSPLLGKEDAIRMQLKISEVNSAKFINSNFNGIIYSDFLHWQYFSNTLMNVNQSRILSDKAMINPEKGRQAFVIRNYAYSQPVQRPTYKLDSKVLALTSKNLNKIYHNGEVSTVCIL